MVRLVGDSTSYRNMMRDAGAAVDQTTAQVDRHVSGLYRFQGGIGSIVQSLKGWALMAGSLVGIGSVLGGTSFAIKLASDAEQAEVAFTSLLKSGDQAKQLLGDLSKFAAETPFEFPQLKIAAKSLLSAGFAAGDLVPMLRNIGDATAAMGTGAEGVQRATYALQQMKNTGKIMGGEMMQLNNAGIPAQKILAAALGRTTEQVAAMAQAGSLGKREMNLFFAAMKSGKGFEAFTGGMEKQSKTVAGLFSTLKDNVGIALTQVGTKIMDALNFKGLIQASSDFVQKWTQPFIAGFTAVIDFIVPAAKSLWTMLGNGAQAVTDWGVTWQNIKPMIMATLAATVAQAQLTYSVVSSVFKMLYGVVSGIWRAIFGEASFTFKDITDTIVETMLIAEFTFSNFGQVASAMWALLQYEAVATFNTIVHWLTTGIPATLVWFGNNWRDIWYTMFDFVTTGLVNIGTNVANMFSSVTDYIMGNTAKLEFAWTPLLKGFKNTIKEMPNLPERVIGDLEKELKAQSDGLNLALAKDFNVFHEMRMKELFPDAATDKLLDPARVAYDPAKDKMTAGIGQAIKHGMEAAIVNSKEAFNHIAEYQMGLSTKGGPQVQAVVEAKKQNEALKEVKTGIYELIEQSKALLTKEPVVFGPSGLVFGS